MQTRHKSHSALAAFAGIYQVRGDLGLKMALLLLTVHVISARITSEFKAAAAIPAAGAPKPSLKVFIASDGSLRLDPKAPAGLSTAELQTAVSNRVAQASGAPIVVALCLSKGPLAEALVGAGLAASQAATNTETLLTINPEP